MRKKRGEQLVEFDIADRFSGQVSAIWVQMAFGLFCFVFAVLARGVVDAVWTSAGPFSLIYPAILISTLYGRWASGLTTFLLAFLHAWYVVLPMPYSFSFEIAGDGARTIVNGCAALFILLFAEIFRRGISVATLERDRQLKMTKILIQELEHRTKNNFAMVSSLLNMQSRDHHSQDVKQALKLASSRVNSFSAIHDSIYSSRDFQEELDVSDYLNSLCESLRKAFASNANIKITLSAASYRMNRDKAVALGLILNEIVTNAIKHAFPDQREGTIHISFTADPQQPWILSISDNGCGIKKRKTKASKSKSESSDSSAKPAVKKGNKRGLGTRLIKTFARNLDAKMETKSSEAGTTFTLTEILDKDSE